ncbi:hypothetical protein [Heyndrickxia coagulans]|uniref:hypothetical protein n=1 Tax=Heyndrickxia coagulans TaxID=1398 RepID=UPI0012FE1A37|nr:hypothetical protein [Heyndrickxia coagulans]
MPKINEIGKNLPTKVTKIYFMNNQLHLEIHTWENYLLPMFVRFSSRIQVVNPKSEQYSVIKQGGQDDSLFLKNERLVYIISGDKKDNRFVLSRNDMKKKKLNESNMNNAFAFLERVARRKLK